MWCPQRGCFDYDHFYFYMIDQRWRVDKEEGSESGGRQAAKGHDSDLNMGPCISTMRLNQRAELGP